MTTTRQQKRSVSPFAPDVDWQTQQQEIQESPLTRLEAACQKEWPTSAASKPKTPKALDDARYLALFIEKLGEAPANDAPQLDALCQFLLTYRTTFEERGIAADIDAAMEWLFDRKTEIFLVDHFDRENCEKMGWPDEFKDMVLFSKERDALAGRYFAPLTEKNPGRFSEFVTRWISSDNPDRLLHFLDFSAGSKNPTFEHYLLFAHPALGRVLKNKPAIQEMFEKSSVVLSKLSSPTWEKTVKAALGV